MYLLVMNLLHYIVEGVKGTHFGVELIVSSVSVYTQIFLYT